MPIDGLTIGLVTVVLAVVVITALGLTAVKRARQGRDDPHRPTLWRRLFERDRSGRR